MQPTLTPDFNYDNMPPAFFPEEALAVPDLPLSRSAVSFPLVTVAPEPTATRKALRIVRAKTGESEVRLFAQDTDGEGTAYVIRTSTINPYKHDDKTLKKGEKLMNEAQARATFERLVAARYPAVVLRENMTVPVHLDLL